MRSCIKTNTERYVLRSNDAAKNPLFVIGLNPSLADENTDDPTFLRMKQIAKNNGFDGIIVINLSPEISSTPEGLHPAKDILAKGNQEIKKEIERVVKTLKNNLSVWCAWGDNVEKKQFSLLRDNIFEIIALFPKETRFLRLYALTKSGNPRHPLYAEKDSILLDFSLIKKLKKSNRKLVKVNEGRHVSKHDFLSEFNPEDIIYLNCWQDTSYDRPSEDLGILCSIAYFKDKKIMYSWANPEKFELVEKLINSSKDVTFKDIYPDQNLGEWIYVNTKYLEEVELAGRTVLFKGKYIFEDRYCGW